MLLYTSGTEGAPKGAMLTHRALLANHEQLDRIEPPVVGPDDIVLLALPLFHAYGLNSGLGAVAYHGATGVLVDRFDPADALDADRPAPGHRAWSACRRCTSPGRCCPTLGAAMASVRVAVCGAAPLDPADRGALHRGDRAPGLRRVRPDRDRAGAHRPPSASPAPKPARSAGRCPGSSCGCVGRTARSCGATATAVADEDPTSSTSTSSSPGTDPGEIVVRGANLFSGYWPDGRDGPDADGWWPPATSRTPTPTATCSWSTGSAS